MCFNPYHLSRALDTSLNPNRKRSIGVFLFFVPKMCPKCDSIGATFVLDVSQKGGALRETNQENLIFSTLHLPLDTELK